MSETVFPSSFRITLLLFEFLFEKVGTTVLQNVLLSVNFLVSRLLKYSFLVFLKNFLQKLHCMLQFFSVCQGPSYHNFFMQVFCHKRSLICSNMFLFNWSILIENWKDCFLETVYILSIKYTGFYVRLKSIIIKIFIIVR